MKAEIIPTGTELLLGNIIDVNSSFLANQLSLLGIGLYFISTVGDNRGRMVDTLKQAWTRADFIITTGGLGPTQGDITREAIAELVGEEPKIDPELWQEVQSFFMQRHQEIPQSNIKQAMVIPSARAIRNLIGTAPGWWVEKDNHIIVALPGPPEELNLMWEESIVPTLRQKSNEVILSKTIKTFRAAESKIDEMLDSFLNSSNPTLATYGKPDGIYLRITAKAKEEAEAKLMITQREAEIKDFLAPYIWGTGEDTLESVVLTLLKGKNLSLATMESCTQGLLCNTIANSPESPTCFNGGLLTCSDEGKIAFGVDPQLLNQYGSESSQVAEAMAETARIQFKTAVGLSVTGSVDDVKKAGNIFVGVNDDKIKQVIAHSIRGNRSRIMQESVYSALFDLRKILLQEA